MQVKNLSLREVKRIAEERGLLIEKGKEKGKWVKVRLKRQKKDFRVVYINPSIVPINWWVEDKGTVKIEYSGLYFSEIRTVRRDRTLGHSDWYGLIMRMLRKGAWVRVLGKTLKTEQEYQDFILERRLEDYISIETEIRSETLKS